MKKYKPTTPSRRHLMVVSYDSLSKVKPLKSLRKRIAKHAGRNHHGRISVRHQGGGNKILYRDLDFRQEKLGVFGVVETIEYDPYRTAFISRVCYADGERRYILAPAAFKVGDKIIAGDNVPLSSGNRMPLKKIPVGTFVHNVEIFPLKGGQFGRSAGAMMQILANEDGYTHLKMISGEIRKVMWDCYASIGQVSNAEHNLAVIGKAGRSRAMAIRPTVRGSAMNPRDHPYGGGEGRAQRGTKRPKTKWGKITGGRKTRPKNKWSSKLILQRRKKS